MVNRVMNLIHIIGIWEFTDLGWSSFYVSKKIESMKVEIDDRRPTFWRERSGGIRERIKQS